MDLLQTPSSALATMYVNTWLNGKSGRLLCHVPTEATHEGSGCTICSGLSVCSCNSLAVKAPKTTAQWHPTRNGGKQPDQVAAFSMMTVWWQHVSELTGEVHEWKGRVAGRVVCWEAEGRLPCSECYSERRMKLIARSSSGS